MIVPMYFDNKRILIITIDEMTELAKDWQEENALKSVSNEISRYYMVGNFCITGEQFTKV